MNNYMTISDARRYAKIHGYIVKDVSGYGCYGYDFAIFKCEVVEGPFRYFRAVGEPVAVSARVWEPHTINKAGASGSYRNVFNRDDLEALHG